MKKLTKTELNLIDECEARIKRASAQKKIIQSIDKRKIYKVHVFTRSDDSENETDTVSRIIQVKNFNKEYLRAEVLASSEGAFTRSGGRYGKPVKIHYFDGGNLNGDRCYESYRYDWFAEGSWEEFDLKTEAPLLVNYGYLSDTIMKLFKGE
jgi:hypothetical protein